VSFEVYSTDMMLPEIFIKRIQNQKYIDAENLQKALKEPSPVSIRINSLKWEKKPADSEPVQWCRNGYYLRSRPSYTSDPLFHAGCYYPQEASGMFVEQVFLQLEGSSEKMRVLDLCGAPGGKSTILSDLIGPDNLLVANEVIRARASILAETITKWDSFNTIVTSSDPASFGKLAGFFDMILIDAPCSGEGMFRTKVAISEWSAENAAHCAERQKRIMMDIWPCLKENGVLIYSTCTFNPSENEENIKWLISMKKAECIRLDIKEFEGISEIDHQGIYGYGFYPDKIRGEGFFISAIRKTDRQVQEVIGSYRLQQMRPGVSDLKTVAGWTDFNSDRIVRWGEEVIALPSDLPEYSYLFKNLKIVKAGTKIFSAKKDDIIPSHEVALSARLKKGVFPEHELTPDQAIAYLRRDNLSIRDVQAGWNIMTYKKIPIGFIKNLVSRINNYFPVEWRIRLDASAIRQGQRISWYE
jgi:16S rRNA C967 or C1407 C5-methylase (RsmB/RsmF family)/NOL1/NOP2/fmu family ribosome biogenesis protein